MGSPVDYIGKRYGLVTVTRRAGARAWVRCVCGSVRSVAICNLISAPPKSHSKCKEMQYELFDSTRTG